VCRATSATLTNVTAGSVENESSAPVVVSETAAFTHTATGDITDPSAGTGRMYVRDDNVLVYRKSSGAEAGVSASIETLDVRDEGVSLGTTFTSFDFLGNNVTANDAGGGVATVNVPVAALNSVLAAGSDATALAIVNVETLNFTTTGPNGIRVGTDAAGATANVATALAIGQSASATAANALVVGASASTSTGVGSVLVGFSTTDVSSSGSVVLGDAAQIIATGTNTNNIAVGDGAAVSGVNTTGAVAFGRATAVSAPGAIAIGSGCTAGASKVIVMGTDVTSSAANSISVGSQAWTNTHPDSVVVRGASSVTFSGVAGESVGIDSNQLSNYTTSIFGEGAQGVRATSIGLAASSNIDAVSVAAVSNCGVNGVTVGGYQTTITTNAVGMSANVSGTGGVGFGTSGATGPYCIALGRGASSGNSGVSIGRDANAVGTNSVAIGHYASTNSLAYCVTIGQSITSRAANSFMVRGVHFVLGYAFTNNVTPATMITFPIAASETVVLELSVTERNDQDKDNIGTRHDTVLHSFHGYMARRQTTSNADVYAGTSSVSNPDGAAASTVAFVASGTNILVQVTAADTDVRLWSGVLSVYCTNFV